MELKHPAQYYWTTLYDRYQPQSLSFAFVPLRSLADNKIPQLDVIAMMLESNNISPGEIQPWHLPVILASLIAGGDRPQSASELSAMLTYRGSIWIEPQKLGFAEYVAYSDVIPFEESPLGGKSLMAIAGMAGVKIGLIAAGGTPMVILTVPLGILLCTAAATLGPELGRNLPRLMALGK